MLAPVATLESSDHGYDEFGVAAHDLVYALTGIGGVGLGELIKRHTLVGHLNRDRHRRAAGLTSWWTSERQLALRLA